MTKGKLNCEKFLTWFFALNVLLWFYECHLAVEHSKTILRMKKQLTMQNFPYSKISQSHRGTTDKSSWTQNLVKVVYSIVKIGSAGQLTISKSHPLVNLNFTMKIIRRQINITIWLKPWKKTATKRKIQLTKKDAVDIV